MSIRKGIQALGRSQTQNAAAVPMSTASYPISSGGELSETAARKLSAVDACIEIISNSIAKLPAFVMDGNTRGRISHDCLHLLNVRPNEAMTPFVRKKVLETSRLEGGAGYDWIVRNPRTLRPEELIPLPWWLVTPWRDAKGHIRYTVTHPVTGAPMVLQSTDICHYKNSTRTGLQGISTLQRASDVIATASAAQQYERAYYEKGGQPSGVLQTNTDLGGYAKDANGKVLADADGTAVTLREQLRREWEKVHAGPSNSHRIAILDLGLEYKAMGASNRDAQFVESKEVAVKDIARFFGVPLYKLQEGKQAYGSNEQNAIEYVVGTLHPIVSQYEEELTWKLLPESDVRKGLEIRINMMAELKGDTSSRANWYRTMTEVGAFCPNNILSLEDLPDIPGGEYHKASLNYVPLEVWYELSIKRNGGSNESNT